MRTGEEQLATKVNQVITVVNQGNQGGPGKDSCQSGKNSCQPKVDQVRTAGNQSEPDEDR